MVNGAGVRHVVRGWRRLRLCGSGCSRFCGDLGIRGADSDCEVDIVAHDPPELAGEGLTQVRLEVAPVQFGRDGQDVDRVTDHAFGHCSCEEALVLLEDVRIVEQIGEDLRPYLLRIVLRGVHPRPSDVHDRRVIHSSLRPQVWMSSGMTST